MTEAPLFALGIALACLAGVRVYLTVFGVGLAGLLGWADLPPNLEVVTSPWVLGTSALLAIVEFAADKIPGVDSGWDLLHTLLRVPVGAFLAGAAFGGDGELSTVGLVVGAGAALLTHGFKAGTRAALNASPEPVSNWLASLVEDALGVVGLALALLLPWLAIVLVVGVLGLSATVGFVLVRRLWRGLAGRRDAVAGA
jgi:hypothetical protein